MIARPHEAESRIPYDSRSQPSITSLGLVLHQKSFARVILSGHQNSCAPGQTEVTLLHIQKQARAYEGVSALGNEFVGTAQAFQPAG